MDVSALQARIDAIPWYHEFDFGNGLQARSRTPDIELHRRIWGFIEQGLETVDLRHKSVLDVGCWDGYWSFYAEKRGARSVLAVDDFSQNWANESGLLLARELLSSRVRTETRTSVYELASLGQKFDVVLMLGVYYHLVDPFYAFAQLRHCCHSETVVCIEGNESTGLPENTAILDLSQGPGKFNPTAGYLDQMLRAAYFNVSARRFLEPRLAKPQISSKWRWRMWRKALFGSVDEVRDMATAVVTPPGWLQTVRRTFLTCRAVEAENSVHVYPPPFGLHVYDPRFNASPAATANPLDSPQTEASIPIANCARS